MYVEWRHDTAAPFLYAVGSQSEVWNLGKFVSVHTDFIFLFQEKLAGSLTGEASLRIGFLNPWQAKLTPHVISEVLKRSVGAERIDHKVRLCLVPQSKVLERPAFVGRDHLILLEK